MMKTVSSCTASYVDSAVLGGGNEDKLRPTGCFRRVKVSPDGGAVLATCDSSVVPVFTVAGGSGAGGDSSGGFRFRDASIRTAEPAIDSVWAPFMTSLDENALVLTCCRHSSIQLWDVTSAFDDDGDGGGNPGNKVVGKDDNEDSSSAHQCRSSYAVTDANEMPVTPHALHWHPTNYSDICAVFENGKVAVFDVSLEGKRPKQRYRPKCAINGRAGGGGTSSILSCVDYSTSYKAYAFGSLNGNVELMDPNTNTCSAILRGHRSGCVQVMFGRSTSGDSDAEVGHYLYTGARGSDARLLVWDIRNLARPMISLDRSPSHRQQPLFFSQLRRDTVAEITRCSGEHSKKTLRQGSVVTPKADGSLLVVDPTNYHGADGSSAATIEVSPRNCSLQSELSHLCAVDVLQSPSSSSASATLSVVAASGHRNFPVRDRYEEEEGRRNPPRGKERPAGTTDSEGRRKRPRADLAPLSDDDDEDEGRPLQQPAAGQESCVVVLRGQ